MFPIVLIVFYSFLKIVLSVSKHPLVLVVSFDSLRHDFVNKSATPNLFALSQLGVRTKYMKNIFPTKTLPVHFSIATGVYAEDHGVLANSVFYNNRSHKYSNALFDYNEDVVPIWTLNEKAGNGRHSGSMMWPGGEFPYQGVKPTHVQPYDMSFNWTKRADTVISWFLNSTAPANFIMAYFDNLDVVGHRFGVNDPSFKAQIQQCDQAAKYIQDQLVAHGLQDKVNVFLLSDHGMVSVKQEHIIDLNKFADLSSFDLTGTSPVVQITAINTTQKSSLINKTYADLKSGEKRNGHFRIFLREEIPDTYHYKHNARVSDMLAVADLGYGFQDLMKAIEYYSKTEKITMTPKSELGIHGYSNDEPSMYPFFMAYGPGLKQNTTVPPFNVVDLYPIFAKLLQLSLPRGTTRYKLRGNLDLSSAFVVPSNISG
nr:PREDICTED: bis(5'-adenosyl)-triphosphatase enpp4-like [Bemisia tabaci]